MSKLQALIDNGTVTIHGRRFIEWSEYGAMRFMTDEEVATLATPARHVARLAYEVVVDNGDTARILATFAFESDALLFARAYFAGDNGGDVTVYDNTQSGIERICAFSFGDKWSNISEGANTDGFNG